MLRSIFTLLTGNLILSIVCYTRYDSLGVTLKDYLLQIIENDK